jgi:uncharacterized lipoprotein YddW (UPF0748 family)
MTNVDSQKTEYIRQLDMHRRNGMNAVIVQVRPAADAFYPRPMNHGASGLRENREERLTFYDPLQFMIEEAHKRGMEFHAWV